MYQHQRQHDALDDQEPILAHSMIERESHIVHYPDHPDRKESALYRQTHHKLCVEMDVGCWICGKKHSQGHQTETHHWFAEWAAQKAIDWKKFGQEAHWMHNPQSGARIGPQFDWDKVTADPTIFVDSPENMVVLCAEHHRDKAKGIHHVPLPEWILQRFPVDGFEFLEAEGGHA